MPEKRVSAQDDRGGGRARRPREKRDRDQAADQHERLGTQAAEHELDSIDDQAQEEQPASADDEQDDGEAAPGRDDGSPSARDTSESRSSRRKEAQGEGDGPTVRRGAHGGRDDQGREGGEDDHDRPQDPQVGQFPTDHLSARDAAQAGVRGLAEVVGNEPVAVTEVSPRHDGWVISVEMVELQRLPSSADILALYEAELDLDGTLRSYRRVRRYTRGHAVGSEDR